MFRATMIRTILTLIIFPNPTFDTLQVNAFLSHSSGPFYNEKKRYRNIKFRINSVDAYQRELPARGNLHFGNILYRVVKSLYV